MNEERTTRFSTAPWFKQEGFRISIIGLGGIGSHLAFQLSRIGTHKFYLYDDDSYEAVNMAGQFVTSGQIGMSKVDAAKMNMDNFSPGNRVFTNNGRFTTSTPPNKIMFGGMDNMEGRKIVYEKWAEAFKGNKEAIYIDGRLSADEFQVITIQGADDEAHKRYTEEFLFDSSQAEQLACTFKQTSFLAAQIASVMTGVFTNWLSKRYAENEMIASFTYNIPFFYSFNSNNFLQKIETTSYGVPI